MGTGACLARAPPERRTHAAEAGRVPGGPAVRRGRRRSSSESAAGRYASEEVETPEARQVRLSLEEAFCAAGVARHKRKQLRPRPRQLGAFAKVVMGPSSQDPGMQMGGF
ncbi:unnamed protein product [Prorocentrum cordatum]|uniref:Uncharacterized protein n=1 Tax=Prorocentrum cordatum TaxID=2364126 RepID=A0ABN9YDT8_9DINO|nr:unnamed protein product [Polarella glacialis]